MIRYSPEEYQALQARIHASLQRKAAAPAKPEPQAKAASKQGGRRNKYGAIRTELDGRVFDSKAEARRYAQLMAMQQAGQISDLQMQVKIPLLPAQNVNGHKEKPVDYICDFVYVRDGETIHEDTKSSATKTPAFVLKRKMALFFHGIIIREVLMD
jgi:hypothetical protein